MYEYIVHIIHGAAPNQIKKSRICFSLFTRSRKTSKSALSDIKREAKPSVCMYIYLKNSLIIHEQNSKEIHF